MAPGLSSLWVGLQKTSTVDFPGVVAATVFFTGCNLRCPFCHNPLLAQGLTPLDFVPVEEALAVIARRRSVLGGVCFTGGEPLLQPALSRIVSEVRSNGLQIKLDTNGLAPERIAEIDPDYTSLDLKTSPSRYRELTEESQPSKTGCPARRASREQATLFNKVRRTMAYLRSSGRSYEYRTTVVPALVERADFEFLCREVIAGERWYLQAFRPASALSPRFRSFSPPSHTDLLALRDIAKGHGIACEVRGA